MIPQSANADIMHELEKDIIWLKDELKDYMHAVWACGKLCGIIDCVVESFYYDAPDGDKFTVPGYVHNGKDLPKKTCTCNDGTTYEQDAYIWNDDVVCTIRVD